MLESILSSPLGDAGRLDENGRGGDPTVNELEDCASALVHKEAAAFACSGTMGNSIALMTCCRPGDQVLVDKQQHLYHTEQFSMTSRFGQLIPVFYESDERGLPIPESVEACVEKGGIKVLVIENTLNAYGGVAIPLELQKRLYEIAHRYGVWVHLDGARLFNAAIALNVEAWEIAQYADSVMFCVSKGIGAPFGSLVCGSGDFIKEARVTQKYLGGGLRQAGIMAAPALYALRNQIPRMKEDHEHARFVAKALSGLSHVRPQEQVDSNIVMLHMVDYKASDYCALIKERGIFAGAPDESKVRLVFYKGIGDEDCEEAVRIIRDLDKELG